MGNQPSKDKKSGEKDGSTPIDREKYPSFNRTDTKESSRSLRTSLKSKIPGGKTESPRSSSAGLPADSGGGEKSDAGSIKSGISSKSNGARSHRGSSSSMQKPSLDSANYRSTLSESPQPPPSPIQSASLGHGHTAIDQARRTGE